MFRWIVLAITLIVWLSCMTLVYLHYKPRELANTATGSRAGLDVIFAEDADPRQVWRIYVDPRRLSGNDALPWNGLDESKFREVGFLDTQLKKRGNDDTRREQLTTAHINIPPEINIPGGQLLGKIHYTNRSDISMDHGLEVFDSSIKLGMGFEIAAHGNRDGKKLKVVTQVLLEGKKQVENRDNIDVGDKDAPVHELMPFQRNREVRRGYSWEIPMLDTSAIDISGNNKPHIKNIRVTCTTTRKIKYDGEFVPAFEVVTEDGKARAWYSADGVVLKQSFRLADTIELIVVRVDPKKFEKLPVTQWREVKQ